MHQLVKMKYLTKQPKKLEATLECLTVHSGMTLVHLDIGANMNVCDQELLFLTNESSFSNTMFAQLHFLQKSLVKDCLVIG
jgi:hypothetical protein